MTKNKEVSDETAALIDLEIKRIIEENYVRAETVLKKHKKDLIKIAEALIKYETINGAQIKALMKGASIESIESIDKEDDNKHSGSSKTTKKPMKKTILVVHSSI